jgi:tRNA (guanine9-N1)-methyltransferase
MKRQRRQEAVLEKKKAKKERKKELKNRDVGEEISETKRENSVWLMERKQRKKSIEENYLRLCDETFSVIIDCRWEDKHKERPLRSLKQQIAFCYGSSRKSPNPVHIYVTSVGPLLRASLEKTSKNNWLAFHPTEKDYTEIDQFVYPPVCMENDSSGCKAMTTTMVENEGCVNSLSGLGMRKKKLVYLTSDATETIDTLHEDCAYIIGGIVDRNSLKGISYETACKQGIRTVKLPLKENYTMTATHVLTVNHVFDILLNYHRLKDWKEAIELVLPPRKNAVAVPHGIGEKGEVGEEGNEVEVGNEGDEEVGDEEVGDEEVGEE